MALSEQVLHRLETERNIWVATVRPDGRPHLTPVWFAWHAGQIYICIKPISVKARNITHNDRVSLSLEDGSSVAICEGAAAALKQPWPESILAIFRQKYDWDIPNDQDGYILILEIKPEKWLVW